MQKAMHQITRVIWIVHPYRQPPPAVPPYRPPFPWKMMGVVWAFVAALYAFAGVCMWLGPVAKRGSARAVLDDSRAASRHDIEGSVA
jgi:hypothetical protein